MGIFSTVDHTEKFDSNMAILNMLILIKTIKLYTYVLPYQYGRLSKNRR